MGVDPMTAQAHMELLDQLESPEIYQTMNFSEWIEVQASLQRAMGEIDPRDLGPTPERAEFVRWNVLACIAELIEMLEETPWKPWATSTQFDRRAVIREAVDAMHFLGNVLRVVDCSGEELTLEFLKKNRRNLQRQLDGYDGRSDKCGHCNRELDELDQYQKLRSVNKVVNGATVTFCDPTHLSLYEAVRKEP